MSLPCAYVCVCVCVCVAQVKTEKQSFVYIRSMWWAWSAGGAVVDVEYGHKNKYLLVLFLVVFPSGRCCKNHSDMCILLTIRKPHQEERKKEIDPQQERWSCAQVPEPYDP